MRIPQVRDAALRYITLTLVGVLMLVLRPDFASAPSPTSVFELSLWSVVGLLIIAAAWAHFTVVVTIARGLRCPNPACRVLVGLSMLAIVGFVAAVVTGLGYLELPLLAVAGVLQLVLAAGLERRSAVQSPLTSEVEVASLP